MTEPLPVGVIGVGSMGRNHARVYRELPEADLVGVADDDAERAGEVARSYDTSAMDVDSLLERAEAVSIVVPTEYHYDLAREAIERDVDVLVEKPFVDRPERGWELVQLADERDVTLQVGHIERFNPAIRKLDEIVSDLDVIAMNAQRLGPPIDREIDVNPVLDLMIHDIDVVRSIADGDVTGVSANHAAGDPYVTATVEFEDALASLTASRITQQKVRTLSITARECRVTVDYIDQSVAIHRRSMPEYVETDGNVRFRDQTVVERPTVQNGEPLKNELESFVEAVVTDSEPIVTGEDGIAALRLAREITGTTEEPLATVGVEE